MTSAAEEPTPPRVHCGRCRTAAPPEAAWQWSTARDEHGRSLVLCPACARSNARSIEAKLDDGWW